MLDLFARGVISDEGIEEKIVPLQSRIAELKGKLSVAEAEVPNIDLHPEAIKSYQSSIANLHNLLGNLDPHANSDVMQTVREIISHVVVHPQPGGGAVAEIFGKLSALIGKDIPGLGEVMVAKEGFEPPTQGL